MPDTVPAHTGLFSDPDVHQPVRARPSLVRWDPEKPIRWDPDVPITRTGDDIDMSVVVGSLPTLLRLNPKEAHELARKLLIHCKEIW